MTAILNQPMKGAQIPNRFLDGMARNAALKPCCRDRDNLEAMLTPDKLVITCKVCGCRHYRLAAERMGG